MGYVKKRKISEIEVLREELAEKLPEVNLLEEQNGKFQTEEKEKLDSKKENVAIVNALSLLENRAIEQKSQENSTFYQWAKEHQLKILAKFQNNATISATFATYHQRNEVIKDLYQKTLDGDFKGVCIDFEKIDDIHSFYRFLIELTPKFRESGLLVAVKLKPQLDKAKVKGIVDFVLEE